jgi:hypothetical protein
VSTAVRGFAPQIEIPKEEVFEICGALALGEALLRQAGLVAEADRMAGLFDSVEGRLAGTQPSGGVSSCGS